MPDGAYRQFPIGVSGGVLQPHSGELLLLAERKFDVEPIPVSEDSDDAYS
jgi:hypothetical protein